jgi:hypothetical protein
MNDVQPTRFYHVGCLPTSETEVSFVCDCPNRHREGCTHIRLFKAHVHCVLQIEAFSSAPHPPAFLVTHSTTLGSFVFSVCSTRGVGLQGGKRTIVSLSKTGRWSCRSCPSRGQCHHEAFAVEYASRAGITNEKGVLNPDLATEAPDTESDGSSPVPPVKSPILYLPVPPPRWCRLSTDTLDYPSPPSCDSPPSLLPLDPCSRCCCGNVKPESTCIVFTISTFSKILEATASTDSQAILLPTTLRGPILRGTCFPRARVMMVGSAPLQQNSTRVERSSCFGRRQSVWARIYHPTLCGIRCSNSG